MRLLHNHKGDKGTQTMCRLRVGSFAVSLFIAISTLYSAVMWPPSTRQFLCTYPSNTSTDPLRTVKRMQKSDWRWARKTAHGAPTIESSRSFKEGSLVRPNSKWRSFPPHGSKGHVPPAPFGNLRISYIFCSGDHRCCTIQTVHHWFNLRRSRCVSPHSTSRDDELRVHM